MNTKNKLNRLSFLKNQMMNSGVYEIEDIEPTICQIFRDIFGIGSEYTKKANKIQNGFIVPSSVKMMYGQATKEQYREEKFKMYMKLISQAEAYVMVEGMDDGTVETSNLENLKSDEHSIFLSYCWNDTERANKIDEYLRKKGIEVTRDIRGVDNWQSLKDFMQTIRENDFAVLLISDSYLKSINCMHEVLEIMKEVEYCKRIFPAIIDTNIYSTEEQIKYVKYWEKRVEVLKKNLMGLGYTNGLALGQELKKSEDIARSIAEFLINIADMKNPDIDNIHEAIYQRIQTYV